MKPQQTLTELGSAIMATRAAHGFITPSSIDSEQERDLMLGKLMLVVTEISEMAEAVRHQDHANFREEMADAIIRLLDIAATMGFDVYQEITTKMEVNRSRPAKHGKLCSL